MLFTILRFLYSLSTISVSISGLISAKVWKETDQRKLHHNKFLSLWFSVREKLALAQLPLHAFVLLPSRYVQSAASLFTTYVLCGNPDSFYGLIEICNWALIVMTITGLVVCVELKVSKSASRKLLQCEVFAFTVWAAVLVSRALARHKGVTELWFYLAWAYRDVK